MSKPFWEQPLGALNEDEWERLCDGCGQCCLIKLQDDETEEIFATDVVCRFYNFEQACCGVYFERAVKKPDCFVIERENTEHYSWLPKTCAYRLRFENQPLPDWHPLISGSRAAMLAAEVAVSDWGVGEQAVAEDALPERVIFSVHGG